MRMTEAAEWLDRIRALDLPPRIRILNVCGGHERSIAQAGLRGVLPPGITLIPGPGCPVCVCPEADILAAMRLAQQPDTIVIAFGDMLRVPANVKKGEPRSLAEVSRAGGAVRAIATPQEAVTAARENPGKNVVFFVAGFETTAAPVAAMLAQGIPENLFLLLALRRTWPAVAMLLKGEAPGFEGLIAPGHVATIMGANEWNFVVTRHRLPAAVAGFSTLALLAALHAVLLQIRDLRPELKNAFRDFVRPAGNQRAKDIIEDQFADFDADWRGIGLIKKSGFRLRAHLAGHDARKIFADVIGAASSSAAAMPPGCDCAAVVMGRLSPVECRLYGRACTPRTPVGPCMVSAEGACRIWWSAGETGQAPAHAA
jgi:hydrogenase expression/formation protein HypD